MSRVSGLHRGAEGREALAVGGGQLPLAAPVTSLPRGEGAVALWPPGRLLKPGRLGMGVSKEEDPRGAGGAGQEGVLGGHEPVRRNTAFTTGRETGE